MLWAEGYTEPEAGSDLASLYTRAVRDGDEWVISGQKTFTTWGTHADMLYCAARTDPDAPRHRGITIFGLPIDQPGISFGPLPNIGGGRQNHTFLDGARVPHENMIGQEGRGWDLIMGGFYGGNIGAAYMDAQQKLDKMVAYCKTARRNGKPLIEDAVVRDQLAEMDLLVQAERLLTYESLSNIQSERPPAFAGAIGAVVSKESMTRFAELTNLIAGRVGQLALGSRWAPIDVASGGPEAWFRTSIRNHAGGTPRSSGWYWPLADSDCRDRGLSPWTSTSNSIKSISPTRRAISSRPAARSARSAPGRPPSEDSPPSCGRRWPTWTGSGSGTQSPRAASAAGYWNSASSTRPWAAPWRPSRTWNRQ